MLTEDFINDRIEVPPDGQIQVHRADRFFRDGVQLAKTYHRHVIAPGDDLTGEDPRVQKVAKAVHTTKVIADHRAAITAGALT